MPLSDEWPAQGTPAIRPTEAHDGRYGTNVVSRPELQQKVPNKLL